MFLKSIGAARQYSRKKKEQREPNQRIRKFTSLRTDQLEKKKCEKKRGGDALL